jgi:hypothetical protein
MVAATVIATSLLEPLRFYPRWLVLTCLAVVGLGVCFVAAKTLKWMVYVSLFGLLIVFLLGAAWWLEQ